MNRLLQSEAGYISHIIHTLDEALAKVSMSQVTPPDPTL